MVTAGNVGAWGAAKYYILLLSDLATEAFRPFPIVASVPLHKIGTANLTLELGAGPDHDHSSDSDARRPGPSDAV